MRHLLLVVAAPLALVCALALPVRAADEPAEWTSPRVQGARAMQFSIRDNFTLGTFEGATLSLQRQRSERSANRFGLSFSLNFGDADDSFSRRDTVRQQAATRDLDSDAQSLELSAHRIAYSDPARRMSFYAGLGPFIGYARSHSHHRFQEAPSSFSTGRDWVEVQDLSEWSAGLDGMIGVDWSFARGLALLAEYSTRLAYSYARRSYDVHQTIPLDSITEEEFSYQSTRLYSNGVRFGLSAYY